MEVENGWAWNKYHEMYKTIYIDNEWPCWVQTD